MIFCQGVKTNINAKDNTVDIYTDNFKYIYELEKMSLKYPEIYKRTKTNYDKTGKIIKSVNYSFPLDLIRLVIPFTSKQFKTYRREKNNELL